jgi:hypothetical protein
LPEKQEKEQGQEEEKSDSFWNFLPTGYRHSFLGENQKEGAKSTKSTVDKASI